MIKEWPSAMFVAALVAILHLHHVGWFDAIDKFSYVVIGNIATLFGTGPDGDPDAAPGRVVVLGIDPETHNSVYLGRSPLDRCKLVEHLRPIYGSEPRMVVIDLEMSPAPSAGGRRDEQPGDGCQELLNQFIKTQVGLGTATVVMAPFGREWGGDTEKWVLDMQRAGVRFGSAKLLSEYGMILSSYDDPRTLAQVAKHALVPDGPDENADTPGSAAQPDSKPSDADSFEPSGHRTAVIDFRKYIGQAHPMALKEWLDSGPGAPSLNGKVVFFGGRYGDDDRHLTVADERYGVDVHAAAFLSAFEPIEEADSFLEHLKEYGIDIAFALILSVAIAWCWEHYFTNRISNFAFVRQRASLYLVLLAAAVVALVFALTSFSLWLYTSRGSWMSPVPIAFAMLLDSFVVGSATEAKDQLNEVKGAPPHGPTGLIDSVRRFVWYDFHSLWTGPNKGEGHRKLAALWILSRRLGWLAVTGFALWSMTESTEGGLS